MKVNAKNLQLLSSVFLVSVALNVTVKWHNERWFRREIRHTLCALPIFLLRKMLLRSNLNDTRHYVRSMIQQPSFEMCLRLLFCKRVFQLFRLWLLVFCNLRNVYKCAKWRIFVAVLFYKQWNNIEIRFHVICQEEGISKANFLPSGLLNSQFNCHTCGKDGVSNSCDADIIALKLTWKTCEKNRIINQIKITENFWDQEVRSW